MTNASAPSTQLTGAEPRYWACGTCRALPGEMCRTITGNPAPSHIDRHRSVARFMRYGIVRAGV